MCIPPFRLNANLIIFCPVLSFEFNQSPMLCFQSGNVHNSVCTFCLEKTLFLQLFCSSSPNFIDWMKRSVAPKIQYFYLAYSLLLVTINPVSCIGGTFFLAALTPGRSGFHESLMDQCQENLLCPQFSKQLAICQHIQRRGSAENADYFSVACLSCRHTTIFSWHPCRKHTEIELVIRPSLGRIGPQAL